MHPKWTHAWKSAAGCRRKSDGGFSTILKKSLESGYSPSKFLCQEPVDTIFGKNTTADFPEAFAAADDFPRKKFGENGGCSFKKCAKITHLFMTLP